MTYGLWYLDGELGRVSKYDDAVLVEVVDYENEVAGQRDIKEFDKYLMPETMDSEGISIWDLNSVLLYDDTDDTPEESEDELENDKELMDEIPADALEKLKKGTLWN